MAVWEAIATLRKTYVNRQMFEPGVTGHSRCARLGENSLIELVLQGH